MRWKVFGILFFCASLFVSCSQKKMTYSNELMLCGSDKVWIIDKEKSEGENIEIIWQWESADLLGQAPDDLQRYLKSMDECKYVDGGKKLLLTSSGGVVLLIERETKKCLFYAHAASAHSADLLPGNKVAVALSTNPKGNSIRIFDVNQSDKVLYEDSLYSGHGSVWIEKRKRFYALGFDELREYSLLDWNSDSPKLKLERSWTIPGKSGHDLSFVSENELLVSEHFGVHLFDIDKETFTPFSPLDQTKMVKSVNYNPKTKELIYTKAETSWWTHNIYIQNPDKIITIPSIDMYKVRTNP